MDIQKIHFLLSMQKELNKLEKSKQPFKKVERLKRQFYQLFHLEELINTDRLIIEDLQDFLLLKNGEYFTVEFIDGKGKEIEQVIRLKNSEMQLVVVIRDGSPIPHKSLTFDKKQVLERFWKLETITSKEEDDFDYFMKKNKINALWKLDKQKMLPSIFNNLQTHFLSDDLEESDEKRSIRSENGLGEKKIHSPKDVAQFFKLFRQPNAFKFLTHDWDRRDKTFNRDELYDTFYNTFEAATKKYNITRQLYSRVQNYIRGNSWFIFNNEKKVNIEWGWNHYELINWSRKNPGLHPIRNTQFKNEMIEPFKQSIEIKNNGQLTFMIEGILQRNFTGSFKSKQIKLINLEKANFYTDYYTLESAFKHILEGVFERFAPEHTLEISFDRKYKKGYILNIITILHKNSKPNRDSNIKGLLKNNLRSVENLLFGLCDWSIEADFDDNFTRVDILKEGMTGETYQTSKNYKYIGGLRLNEEEFKGQAENPLEGFKHILTFYY